MSAPIVDEAWSAAVDALQAGRAPVEIVTEDDGAGAVHTVKVFGAYVGRVFRSAGDGRWIASGSGIPVDRRFRSRDAAIIALLTTPEAWERA